MAMYSNAYLEYHADQFWMNAVYKHGITLDQYLADPDRYTHLLTAVFPLLPAQTKVRVRLIREEVMKEEDEKIAQDLDGLPRNNARPFQPLRHHSYPKRRGIACCFKRSRNPQLSRP